MNCRGRGGCTCTFAQGLEDDVSMRKREVNFILSILNEKASYSSCVRPRSVSNCSSSCLLSGVNSCRVEPHHLGVNIKKESSIASLGHSDAELDAAVYHAAL